MKRKVILLAGKTHVVSLPIKWVRKNNIMKGDELELTEKENSITIFPQETDKKEEKLFMEIDLSDFDILIPRTIQALYKRGYDRLRINFSRPEHLSLVQKAMGNETIGYEIVKQEDDYCVIEVISETLKESFDNILRKTFLSLLIMAEGGSDAITKMDIIKLKNVSLLEETNNRLTTFCRRALNKRCYIEENKKTFLYVIIEQLEKIADEYKYLFNYLIENKDARVSKEVMDIYLDVCRMMRAFYESFYGFDAKKLMYIAKIRKSIVKDIEDHLSRKNKADVVVMHHLVIIAQEIFNLIGPLVAIKL